MIPSICRLKKLYEENQTATIALIRANNISFRGNSLSFINKTILDAGIDSFIYESMEKEILRGNFDVIYLDDRLVTNKKREKAQKALIQIRESLNKRKNQGFDVFEILFS